MNTRRTTRNFNSIFFCCLVFSLWYFTGCATAPPPEEEEKTREEIRTEDTTKASTEGTTAEKATAEAEEPDLYETVSSYLAQDDREAAVELLENRAEDDKAEAEELLILANLYLGSGEYGKAEQIFRRILDSGDKNADALFGLSVIEGIKGNKEDRKTLLEETIEADDAYAEAYSALGYIYLEENIYKKAEEVFRKALAVRPEDPLSLLGMAHLYYNAEKYTTAMDVLDRALAQDPSLAAAYVLRSRVHLKKDNFSNAEADLSAAVELEGDYFWHYIDRGRLRSQIGKLDAALEDYNAALVLDPDSFIAYFYRANVYDFKDMVKEAIADYEKSLKLRPDYSPAYTPLGILYFIQEDWKKAEELFKKAYKKESDYYSYVFLIYLAMIEQGETKAAYDFLNEKVNEIPRDDLFYDMGRFYLTPANDQWIFRKVEDEEDLFTKTRMRFYLACQYELQEKMSLANALYLEVKDEALRGLIETRIAEWRLKRIE
jgi:tetratricopeptide (TPR) repeat protein